MSPLWMTPDVAQQPSMADTCQWK